jgi:hypothetical protein
LEEIKLTVDTTAENWETLGSAESRKEEEENSIVAVE